MKKNGEYVGVDEQFIPEDEKYVDESLLGNKEETRKKVKKAAKSMIIIYIIIFVVVLAAAIGIGVFVMSSFRDNRKAIMDDVDSKSSSMRQDFDEMKQEYDERVKSMREDSGR